MPMADHSALIFQTDDCISNRDRPAQTTEHVGAAISRSQGQPFAERRGRRRPPRDHGRAGPASVRASVRAASPRSRASDDDRACAVIGVAVQHVQAAEHAGRFAVERERLCAPGSPSSPAMAPETCVRCPTACAAQTASALRRASSTEAGPCMRVRRRAAPTRRAPDRRAGLARRAAASSAWRHAAARAVRAPTMRSSSSIAAGTRSRGVERRGRLQARVDRRRREIDLRSPHPLLAQAAQPVGRPRRAAARRPRSRSPR